MPKTQRPIILIGFMGSGKSSVGEVLAQQLGWPRFDTDEIVARDLGLTIPEIFARHGEEFFRDAEAEVVRQLDGNLSAVIVTGGGTVLRTENVVRLRELGTIVWLRADLATLQQRLVGRNDRPLLQTENPAATIAELLARREKFYEAAADFAVDTSARSPRESARAVLDELRISS
jgi:shikimate kinase